ncbi:fumarylacetoacetate hydrolase family protein [Natronobacterium gregoryi]|uniref:2-keto-4-pentenoate hydratase/2-oxohepta-3-ene-1,7-dioic acid hydratase n=2 Tax=Natronobacterium gregoryi TaxID=44930 RepID=L0AMU0_NATGS|nr:fumarylacetoacetate hydrolase family protein [Natronobacterium gregoryi]AFZ74390.1 2-keto-4-pentenoate hydratase/2-oxohepta-3-ene-1,7-dioic acid hydratase [Natronobacterium gregoryi SP2]PLK22101.1 FAA hydrolase family protein [Natronobacterium gregoryi SP2]SFJ61482.1 2-keto-4-pentenoate hydratase/2-oxohepta-3-ene-1,7-dioic acid hydratase (catechol pathway) [Natronobacterium gregoryi]
MKYLARTTDGRPLLGDEEGFVPLPAAAPDLETVADALPRAAAGTLPDLEDVPADRIDGDHRQLGPPLAEFGKLWGIGLNYEDHAGDLGEGRPEEPASFMKPSTAVTGPGGPIRLPPVEQTDGVTAEAELAVVIGRGCRNLEDESTVDDVVAGYLPVVDVTAEDVLQRNPRFLTRAKSFDTFLVVGPAIAVPEDSIDLEELTVKTIVNGEIAAENEVRNMLFPPREIVAFHSRVMTLEAGDLFSTGTPGAEPIESGDHVRADIEGIGSVEAPVVRCRRR